MSGGHLRSLFLSAAVFVLNRNSRGDNLLFVPKLTTEYGEHTKAMHMCPLFRGCGRLCCLCGMSVDQAAVHVTCARGDNSITGMPFHTEDSLI